MLSNIHAGIKAIPYYYHGPHGIKITSPNLGVFTLN